MSERKSIFEWAVEYVGDVASFEARGLIVRDLLIAEGMKPHHDVLELGCGALSSGQYLIDFLDPDKYIGMDPNGWLIEAGLKGIKGMKEMMVKRPLFLFRDDFNAREAGRQYDFVVAHSILSHAAGWQLPLMLTNVRNVLNPGGKFLVSFRQGPSDSNALHWAYPDISWFTAKTVRRTARDIGFRTRFKREYRKLMVSFAPNDYHDWAVLERVAKRWTEFQPYSEDYLRVALDLPPYAIGKLMDQGAGHQVERTD